MATESIDALRTTLAKREALLANLRTRLKAAKEEAARPQVKSTISAIQQRYLSAVADLETKRTEENPVVSTPSTAVSSLANRWNRGIDGKKIERANVTVRGDVTSAKKTFSNKDVPQRLASKASSADTTSKTSQADEDQPAEFIIEDDDGVPSWAKNQRKMVIRKENARSSIRDVDVRELQGSVLEQGTRDGSEIKGETAEAKGNVKAALAMWGKTADEDARILEQKKAEEEKQAAEKARMEKIRIEEARQQAIRNAIDKFASLSLADLTDEPGSEVEVAPFLQRKIHLVNAEINNVEEELAQLQNNQ